MESLKTIQALSKIGKVLSTVTFVLSVVGVCLCIFSLIVVASGVEKLFTIGGVTVYPGIFAPNMGKEVLALIAAWMIVCAGEAVVSCFVKKYFSNELKEGTPFGFSGAKELKRLGIIVISVTLGCYIFAEIAGEIILEFMDITSQIDFNSTFDNEGAIAIGIMFIVFAQFCKHGAEVSKKRNASY